MNAKALQYHHTAHFFHALMTLISGGFWIVIWVICYVSNKNHNDRVDQNMMFMNMHNRLPSEEWKTHR